MNDLTTEIPDSTRRAMIDIIPTLNRVARHGATHPRVTHFATFEMVVQKAPRPLTTCRLVQQYTAVSSPDENDRMVTGPLMAAQQILHEQVANSTSYGAFTYTGTGFWEANTVLIDREHINNGLLAAIRGGCALHIEHVGVPFPRIVPFSAIAGPDQPVDPGFQHRFESVVLKANEVLLLGPELNVEALADEGPIIFTLAGVRTPEPAELEALGLGPKPKPARRWYRPVDPGDLKALIAAGQVESYVKDDLSLAFMIQRFQTDQDNGPDANDPLWQLGNYIQAHLSFTSVTEDGKPAWLVALHHS